MPKCARTPLAALLMLMALTSCTEIVIVPDHSPWTPPSPDAPPVDRAIFPRVGTAEFTTANQRELLSEGTGDWADGRNARSEIAEGDAAAGASPGSETPPQSTAPEPMPEPDPSRLIVEGDIFKVEGSTLYVLHRFRGLLTFDLSVPDRIKLLGRLPFQAMPVEMYVRDGRAYAVVSDHFTYWQYDKDADPHGFHGSMVLIADVSQPSSPLLLGKLEVDGQVTDTRMVGDVLYVVSRRNPDYWRYNTADWNDTTWVVSMNVADPGNLHEVERLEFPGASTVMHVYHHAIFVAAHDPNQWLVDPAHENETLVTYVDISEPGGKIRKRGSLYLPGYIRDKFKLDYHERTLRVFSQRSQGGQSDGFLHTVDVSFPDEPRRLATVDLSSGRYGWLAASRMAGPRGYAVTQRWDGSGRTYHDLHVLDLAEPTLPIVTGSLRIPGWISHFEVRGDRLLGLGQTWEQATGWSYYASLTLFDVADPALPRALSSAKLGAGHSYTLANQDYKALRVVDAMGLILVPLSFWDGTRSFTGTQLVDLERDLLRPRGIVANASTVERAFPVGERLVALSQHQIQILDARDRDRPVATAAMNLIRNVLGAWNVQGKQVQLVGEVLQNGARFEVLPFGPEDDAPAWATLPLPFRAAPVVFRDGDVLRLIGWEEGKQVIRNADFADPTAPRLRGRLEMASEFERIYNEGFPFYYLYWSPWAGLPLENRILPVTVRRIVTSPGGRRDFQSWLRLIDLRDPDFPRIAQGEVPLPKWPFVNKVTHGSVLHSSHVEEAKTETGNTLLFHVKSYLDRIDVSDPDHPRILPKVNIPGYLVDVSADGRLAYTIDYQWDAFGRRRNSLNVLRLEGDEAILVDVLPVGDQVNRAVFRDRRIWLVTHKYPWWGVHSDTIESRQPYTVLSRLDVSEGGSVTGQASAKLHGYHFDLLDVEAERIFLASRWPNGILVVDARDASRPVTLSAARTVGYVSRVVLHGDWVYLPLGWFGVHRVAL